MAQQQPEKPTNWPLYNFCFTYNNYTEPGETALIAWLTANTKYAVFGHEFAPTTGTPHLQGYFSLKKKSRMTTLHKQFKELKVNLALLRAKGTAEENLVYCTKADPDGFYQHGALKNCGTGNRSDLIEIAEKLKKGTTIEAVAFDHPVEYIKYHKGLKSLSSVVTKMRVDALRDITTTVYWGIGGSGKTYKAREDCLKLGLGEPYLMMNPNNNCIWFDNYNGEKGLIIDDFYGWVKPHILFRYLDRYVLQLPIKGDTTYAQWSHVWITSNKHPREWYKPYVFENLDKEAYYRRLHNIYFCSKDEDGNRYCQIEIEDKPLAYVIQNINDLPVVNVPTVIQHPEIPPNMPDLNVPLKRKRITLSTSSSEEELRPYDKETLLRNLKLSDRVFDLPTPPRSPDIREPTPLVDAEPEKSDEDIFADSTESS